jgi:hypothetical protein
MHLVCYLRDGGRGFETYSTTLRDVEVMDNSCAPHGPDRVRPPGIQNS